ncbi:MAG: ABC transporter permease, partial [Lachnospiraceae bacterium]|nr:ABC transporter permease [Lachnospiraceae bacterium]
MKEFINNLKKFRFLFWELVKKDIKLKYRSSVLGVFWTLLEPLLTMIVLTLVFSNLLGKGDDNFPVYILCGRLLYGY